MIKKFLIYLKSGGLNEVFRYISIYLRKIVYYKSETIFLYLAKEDVIQSDEGSDIFFKIYNNSSELKSLCFDRIKILNYEKWFAGNSHAIIGFSSTLPVSFSWSHFHGYSIHGLCKIDLSDDKCWIGPTFVCDTLRGKGVNKAQLNFQIMNTPGRIKFFLTSANSNNIASIKSFEKLGFKTGLKIIKYYGAFPKKRTRIYYENDGESIFKIL